MTDKSRPLRAGFAGCGGFGRSAYVSNVVENSDASCSRPSKGSGDPAFGGTKKFESRSIGAGLCFLRTLR
jgi:hypothetical protein